MTNTNKAKTINSIGIDFDNTIVYYDDIFYNLAFNKGWIKKNRKLSKNEIRDFIHKSNNGIEKWKVLQSMVYSSLISKAPPMPEVFKFIKICNDFDISVHIVSHKTKYAEINTSGNNLRKKALEWIYTHKAKYRVNLPDSSINFMDTREDKIKLIKKLKFDYFIDDLEEVLCHPIFPKGVRKILINGNKIRAYKNCSLVEKKNWTEIKDYIFGR